MEDIENENDISEIDIDKALDVTAWDYYLKPVQDYSLEFLEKNNMYLADSNRTYFENVVYNYKKAFFFFKSTWIMMYAMFGALMNAIVPSLFVNATNYAFTNINDVFHEEYYSAIEEFTLKMKKEREDELINLLLKLSGKREFDDEEPSKVFDDESNDVIDDGNEEDDECEVEEEESEEEKEEKEESEGDDYDQIENTDYDSNMDEGEKGNETDELDDVSE